MVKSADVGTPDQLKLMSGSRWECLGSWKLWRQERSYRYSVSLVFYHSMTKTMMESSQFCDWNSDFQRFPTDPYHCTCIWLWRGSQRKRGWVLPFLWSLPDFNRCSGCCQHRSFSLGPLRERWICLRYWWRRWYRACGWKVQLTDVLLAGFGQEYDTVFATPGIAEKGYINVNVEVETVGGHSSIPPDHTVPLPFMTWPIFWPRWL